MEEVTHKVCSKCQELKTIDSFVNAKAYAGGKYSQCRDCTRIYQKERYESGPARNAHLRKTFGITLEDYDMMLSEQGGVCAICGGVNENGQRLSVDHCHDTESIRSLLCSKCNVMLGNAKDDPEILRQAALYLEMNQDG